MDSTELEDAATLDEDILLLDPIAALQDDEEEKRAEDDEVEVVAEDDDLLDDDLSFWKLEELIESMELLEADPGTESGMTEEEDVSDSKFVAFAEATKEEFSSPQATRSIKKQIGNILYKFIFQIPFFT